MLKREVSQLKEGGVVKGGASEGEHMEDLTRLRAENTVLQKSLHGQHVITHLYTDWAISIAVHVYVYVCI